MASSWPFFLTDNKAPRPSRQNAVMLGGTLVCIASLCLAGRSLANPLGEKVKFGSAEFLRNGTKLEIQQSSKTLILDWREFSIQEGEVTRFLQPGSSSAAVNRVLGGNPSELHGSLKGNGQIFLINPNGVFIGRSGRVDAGGFAASTLDASDEHFIKGGEIRFQGDSDASVVNLGSIHALDGNVFLIAKTVENHGSIKAPNGTVGLFGGTDLLLQPEGDETLGVSIASGPGKSVNAGRIAAAQAELKAAGGNLYALAIQNSGVIRATGVHHKGGRVFLRASGGTIENSGTIAAKTERGAGGRIVLGSVRSPPDLTERSSNVDVVNRGGLDASGSRGGLVEIEGENISLEASSRILAIGAAGSGGDVAIRGTQSIGTTQGGLVDASGLRGGSVELGGGRSIDFAGELVANGSDGAGGSMMIEAPSVTIGSGVLDTSGATGGVIGVAGDHISVDRAATFAANGAFGGGRLKLVATSTMQFHGSISAAATSPGARGGMAEVSGFGSLDYQGSTDLRSGFGPAGTLLLDPSDFTIDPATAAVIANNLRTSSVVIATSPAGSGNGDILVNAPLIFNGPNNLSLLAHRHITVNASVQNGGSGDINLVAGWDGVTGSTEATFDLFASTPSSFGNQLGTIAIGSGAQSAGVAVGSRNGMTNAAAFGMMVTGSGTSNNAFARIGFSRDITSEIQNATGPIQITLKGNLAAAGGGASFSYAQIGHDGSSVGGTFQGRISISAVGAVQITGGGDFAYAQLGHGGGGSQSHQSGEISIGANSLSIAGGVGSNAYAQVGHGAAAGGSSGSRVGRIDIRVLGEATLVNGGAPTGSWMIGHRTSSSAAVTSSPVHFAAGALDYNTSALAVEVSLAQDFVEKFALNLAGGDVTVEARGPGRLIVDGNFDYSSPHKLTLLANNSADVNASVVNRGEGEIVLVVDAANISRPVYNSAASLQIAPGATLSSGGAVRVFATEPARTQLGGFTPALRHYNIWFGDPVTVNGVNFKFQPTLTLATLDVTKTYGQSLSSSQLEFTIAGLQPGDSLAQILLGTPQVSSLGTGATAGVSGSPYHISFADGLSVSSGYALQLVHGSLTVTPAALTLTARNQSKVYGNTFNFNGTEFTSLGLVNGDVVNSVSLTSAGAMATTGVSGSPYSIVASNATGNGLGNYTIGYLPGALSVTPAALTLTARNQSKVYGTALTFNGTEFTSLGLVNGDVVNSVSLTSAGAIATADVGGSPYSIVASNATGNGLGNYTIGYLPGALSVTPAALTLTARNQSKVYGTALTFNGTEFTSLGLVNGDVVNSVSLTSAGAIATADVGGSPYSIVASNATGNGLGNYTIGYLPGALSVTPAALTLTALNQSKVYGNTLTFNGTEFTSLGLVNGDAVNSVSLTSAGAIAAAGVGGSPYSITASNATGSGLGNYTIGYLPGALSVTPAALTLTALNQTKVYGNTLTFNGTEFTSLGLVNGDAVNSVSLTSAGAIAAAGVGGSPYSITASNATGSGLGNYTIGYLPGALSVTPAALTLTALNQTKVYGNTLTFNGTEFTSLGLVNGDAVNSVSLTSAGAIAAAGVGGSPYSITASNAMGSGLGNYTIGYLPGALSVTPAALTLTARNQSKVYGNTLTFNGTEFTSLGLVNGDAVNSVSLTSAGAIAAAGVGGSPYSITASNAMGSGLGNYTIGYLPGALSVTPAALTLTARNQTKVYGNTLNFSGTEFTSLGLVNGDAVNSVSLTSAGAIAAAGVGGSPYSITASNATGSGLGNYTIGYLPGALSVTPAALTLTALNQTKVYGNTLNFSGTEFTSLGLVNGDAVNSVSLTSAGAIAAAGVGGSPYSITASNATGSGLGNYTIGYLPGALSVTPAALTLTARNQTKVYGNTLTFNGTEFTSLGLVNGDVVNSVSLTSAGAIAAAGVGGSPYSITASNATGSGLGNYTIGYLPGALSVTPAALTLTARNQTKVYGNTLTFNGTEFTSLGLVNGDVVNSVSLTSAGAIATADVGGSPYSITASNATGSGLGNYTIGYLPGALSVTPAALTLTARNQSKVYGNTLTFNGTEFTSLGLVNGDVVNSVSLTSAGAIATAGVGGSPYSITASNATGTGSGLGNYTIGYLPGALSVTPAALTLTALNQTKVYGNTLTFNGTEFTSLGLQNGETISLVDLASIGTGLTAGVAAGPYAITIANPQGGNFNPANYTLILRAGSLEVEPARLVITAHNQRKPFGTQLELAGTEFSVRGLQNGETIGLVTLSSLGSPASAGDGQYAIGAANARGGSFDAANYEVSYAAGILQVLPPPPPPPPVVTPAEVQKILAVIEQTTNLASRPASEPPSGGDEPSVISTFGIQRPNLTTFFGEQLLEPGGALMIDQSGVGPPLPIGEAPQSLEDQLAEEPHDALEEAIAEDDRRRKLRPRTRLYDLAAGEVFTADKLGEVSFQLLRAAPDVLRQATDEGIESRLLQAATNP